MATETTTTTFDPANVGAANAPSLSNESGVAPANFPTLRTQTKVTDQTVAIPDDWVTVRKQVGKWAGAVLGLVAAGFVVLVIVAVLVALLVAKADPLPDSNQRSFEWFTNDGRGYNNMTSGSMAFALWANGNASVVNMNTGEIPFQTTNSLPVTNGMGDSMTLSNGTLKIFAKSQQNPLGFSTAGADDACSNATLTLIPTGELVWRCSDGKNIPFVWKPFDGSS